MTMENRVSLMQHTLTTAPVYVIKSTVSFGILGAITGSVLGVVKNVPAIPSAFQTGLNTTLFSFTFFSIREYGIHPLLTALSLRPSPLLPLPSSSESTNPHLNNLLSTALAGLASGSIFSYFARGGSTTGNLRAAATLSLGCTVVQGLVNEGDGMRIRALHWSEERSRRLAAIDQDAARQRMEDGAGGVAEEKAVPPTYTRSISSPTPSVPSRETFSERSDRLFGSAFVGLTDFLARISPVKKMDDEEYEKALRSRLSEIDLHKQRLEDEMNELDGGDASRRT